MAEELNWQIFLIGGLIGVFIIYFVVVKVRSQRQFEKFLREHNIDEGKVTTDIILIIRRKLLDLGSPHATAWFSRTVISDPQRGKLLWVDGEVTGYGVTTASVQYFSGIEAKWVNYAYELAGVLTRNGITATVKEWKSDPT